LSQCCDIGLDRFGDPFTVLLLLEAGHEALALNLPDEAVRHIAFKVTADLREVFTIINGDN
jgi:hypothetical protein